MVDEGNINISQANTILVKTIQQFATADIYVIYKT